MAAVNGQADSVFIAEVRRILRDQPAWFPDSLQTDGTRGTLVAGSQPFRLQRAPVYTASNPAPVLTAPAGLNMTGLSGYFFVSGTSPWPNPVGLSDVGAGPFASATYQGAVTLVVGGLESGLSPLSAGLAVGGGGRAIRFNAISGLASNVTAVNYYIVTSSAGGSAVGFVGTQVPVAGAVGSLIPGGVGAGQIPVFLNSDTGEIVFPVAPVAGTLAVTHQAFRFSDQQVLDALGDGLNLLWPEIHPLPTTTTTALIPTPVQYEYQPSGLSALTDPRAIITEVEVSPVGAYVRYQRIGLWRQVEDALTPTIAFSKPIPAAASVRVSYVAPYATLGATSTAVQNLPVYYAVARLCMDQEIMRSRADDMPALTGESTAPAGTAQQVAAFWLDQFAQQLQKLGLDPPVRKTVAGRAVERLGLSSFWQAA